MGDLWLDWAEGPISMPYGLSRTLEISLIGESRSCYDGKQLIKLSGGWGNKDMWISHLR